MGSGLIRIYGGSGRVDPASLRPGRDLVLKIEEHLAWALPDGVFAEDHLRSSDRPEIDDGALAAVAAWRRHCAAALTFDGTELPWIWELELLASAAMPVVRDATALSRALRAHRPARIELINGSEAEELTVRSVARGTEVEVASETAAVGRSGSESTGAAAPGRRGLVGAALRLAAQAGVPSKLRRDSTVMAGYWPLMPTLDRMLSGHGDHRPAVYLEMRPVGARRSIRCALAGGWLGTPSRRLRGESTRRFDAAIDRVEVAPEIGVNGVDLGPSIHRACLDFARRRGAIDLARIIQFRREFARGNADCVVVPFDVTPEGRSLVHAAQRSGVRTLVVSHGGYWIGMPVRDLETSDEVALWSDQPLGLISNRDRPIHVIGYPGDRPPASGNGRRRAHRHRIVILEQLPFRDSALLDRRASARHYTAALEAIRGLKAGVEVVLRPHPGAGLGTTTAFAQTYSDLAPRIESGGDIFELLASADACVGSLSTATLQCGLADVPMVMLNVTGIDWRWPLGGETPVPVARSADELTTWLQRVLSGELIPGRAALLDALGCEVAGNPSETLLAIIDGDTGDPAALPGAKRT